MRFVLSPTRAPSASSSGLPDEPGASGAVCSTEPEMRRPPGPRNARATDDTNPNDTRGPPLGVAAAANTAEPIVALPSDQAIAGAPVVSTSTTARSPSQSTPFTAPRSVRPSANRTVTSAPRRLWALVRTRPSATTTPEPRRREPIPTTDGPTAPATAATDSWSSLSTDMGCVFLDALDAEGSRWSSPAPRCCNLQSAIYYPTASRARPSPTIDRTCRRSPPRPLRRPPSPPRSIVSATAGACCSSRRCSPVPAGSGSSARR